MLKDRVTLKDSCRLFRDRFQPGQRDPHCEACADCARWAELLESSISTEARRPLPPGLRQRLQDIPQNEVACRDVDRLYRATLDRARPRAGGRSGDPAGERHLASCARCGELYSTLYSAFAARRLPMPVRLARRLKDIARHPERLVPWWISDTRYAAAACYLLATLTLALAGDASAVFRDTTATVSSKAQVLAATGEDRGAEIWDAVAASLSSKLGEGWHHAARYTAAGERWLQGVGRVITNTTRELLPDQDRVEGENDDRPSSDRS